MLVQVGQESAIQQVEPETPPVSGEAVLRELAVQSRVLDLNADSQTSPVADSQVVEPVAREPLNVDRDAFGGAQYQVDKGDASDEVLVRVAVVGRPQVHAHP